MSHRPLIMAVLDATIQETGVTRLEILSRETREPVATARRVFIYVAYFVFRHEQNEIERLFGYDIRFRSQLLELKAEQRASQQVRFLINRVRDRARGLLDEKVTTSASREPDPPAFDNAGLPEHQVAEARKLRRMGWAMSGLSKRYGIPLDRMAEIVGEKWGVEA